MASSKTDTILLRIANIRAELDALTALVTAPAPPSVPLLLPSTLMATVTELTTPPSSPAPVPSAPIPGAPKKVGRPRKLTPLLPSGLTEPAPSAYRLSPSDIKLDVCVGRICRDSFKDTRWSKPIYGEAQCGATVEEGGSDLCAACAERAAHYETDKTFHGWVGRVTEEPYPWQHMLGTAWAKAAMESGKLFWNPAAAAAVGGAGTGDNGSVTSSDSADSKKAATAATAAKKEALKVEKEAKTAKKAEETAAKAAAKAEKEAEKAAKEAKTAKKAEEKAEKLKAAEAAKAAKAKTDKE